MIEAPTGSTVMQDLAGMGFKVSPAGFGSRLVGNASVENLERNRFKAPRLISVAGEIQTDLIRSDSSKERDNAKGHNRSDRPNDDRVLKSSSNGTRIFKLRCVLPMKPVLELPPATSISTVACTKHPIPYRTLHR